MKDEEDYDVVLDVLQQRRDELRKMIDINMRANMFNIMDTIRLGAIDEIDEAMRMWKEHKNRGE